MYSMLSTSPHVDSNFFFFSLTINLAFPMITHFAPPSQAKRSPFKDPRRFNSALLHYSSPSRMTLLSTCPRWFGLGLRKGWDGPGFGEVNPLDLLEGVYDKWKVFRVCVQFSREYSSTQLFERCIQPP